MISLNKLPRLDSFFQGWSIISIDLIKSRLHHLKSHQQELCLSQNAYQEVLLTYLCSTQWNCPVKHSVPRSWLHILDSPYWACSLTLNRCSWWNHSGIWMWCIFGSQSHFIGFIFMTYWILQVPKGYGGLLKIDFPF